MGLRGRSWNGCGVGYDMLRYDIIPARGPRRGKIAAVCCKVPGSQRIVYKLVHTPPTRLQPLLS